MGRNVSQGHFQSLWHGREGGGDGRALRVNSGPATSRSRLGPLVLVCLGFPRFNSESPRMKLWGCSQVSRVWRGAGKCDSGTSAVLRPQH